MDKVKIVLNETTDEVQATIDRVCKKYGITTDDGSLYVGSFAGCFCLCDALRRIKSFCQNVSLWEYFDEDDLEGQDMYKAYKMKGLLNDNQLDRENFCL